MSRRAVQALASDLAGRTSASTARIAISALSTVLRDAYEQGLTDVDPPSRLRLPAPPPPRNHIIDLDATDRLLVAARADDLRQQRSFAVPFIALLANTGLRISEALGLRWGATGVDLAGDLPVVRIGHSKTAAGEREVVLDTETTRILREHRLASGRPAEGDLVFPGRDGREFDRGGAPRSTLRRVAKAAGVSVSAHTFRHSHASMLHSAGVPVAAFAKRLGHADPRFTMARYVKASDHDVAAIAQVIDARRAAGSDPSI